MQQTYKKRFWQGVYDAWHLDGIPARAPPTRSTRCGLVRVSDVRRRQKTLGVKLREEIHGGVIALLLDFLELTKLKGAIL